MLSRSPPMANRERQVPCNVSKYFPTFDHTQTTIIHILERDSLKGTTKDRNLYHGDWEEYNITPNSIETHYTLVSFLTQQLSL